MGTGIVFVYLLIAAVITPVAWLFWWGADSFTNPRRRPETVSASPVRQQSVFTYPTPVDLDLPSRADAVTIYNRAGRKLSVCAGPDARGGCPHPAEDGTVPCSGCLLALPQPIRGSFEWHIPKDYKFCPLGTYSVFRQAN